MTSIPEAPIPPTSCESAPWGEIQMSFQYLPLPCIAKGRSMRTASARPNEPPPSHNWVSKHDSSRMIAPDAPGAAEVRPP